ncbi:rho GTPase-activating protein 23 isoform X3 [Oryzias latipes]|uniref:rho GTPase-activating protein 23 isoform X3 n=1 Tax=Oryzias latipes TaxID=8090 RepID=UPI000CE238EC|nr:rho GTPase-activating protein 23 isoform X3 [Oryzias latipes]
MNGVTFCLVGIPPEPEAKGQRYGKVSSNESRRRPLSSGDVEGSLWQGPRTIYLQKNSQGFGFTLRHFIVYPPESSIHCLKEEENSSTPEKKCQRSRLEPVDTIFVKSVKENGPAHEAGLCTGDRLVKVNGESVLGKTYSQVIMLIQNSEDILELSIMPKDEDVLQLAYSQDAAPRGYNLRSSKGLDLIESPPLCYHSTKCQPNPDTHTLLDNRQCRLGAMDYCPSAEAVLTSGWSGVPDESSYSPTQRNREQFSSPMNVLDFHFANHNAAITSATLPPPRKSSLPTSFRSYTSPPCSQALSDWYYSQAKVTEHVSSHQHSISQDHLEELAMNPALGTTLKTSAGKHRRETLLLHHPAAAASHNSCWPRDCGGASDSGSRPCSESLLAAYAEYEHNYGRSVETLTQASQLVSSHSKIIPQKPEQKEPKASGGHQQQSTALTMMPPNGRQPCQQVAEPQTKQVKEEWRGGYKSQKNPFPNKAGHIFQNTQSFSESSFSGPHLHWSPSTTENSERVMPARPKSASLLSASDEEAVQTVECKEVTSSELVLRLKPTLLPSHRSPLEEVPPQLTSATPSPGSTPSRRANGSLAQHAFDSLSSIPFIGSIKSRRSSYLLAITTERSKSCDEGLNTFREESQVFSKLPKRVRSFFTDGSLESLQAQEEACSKRHSTSELGTTAFSDVRKEGWLHYKQILTEKGKKVGGSIRPWKRAFTVLRSHLLFLYKDKREAVLHAAGAQPCQEDHPPICIRGCLIDIAYCETKRKHTLRLTTQDFCEYLLQAEDRDSMLAWIRVIRESSKTDNEEICFSRQALINKKLNDYRKHSLTGNKLDSSPKTYRMMSPFLAKTDNTSVNRVSKSEENKALWGISLMKKAKKTSSPKAFGIRLEDCQPAVNHKFVPLIVEMCCEVVETIGLEYTGIYRVPGNNAMVSNLQEHLNKGLNINITEERWQDLNVISSLLKSFFRKLPEPLFTDDKYGDFIDANRIKNTEDRLKTMKKLIHDLPDYYHHTLKFLVGHLKRVADHSEKNKMEPRNLALVFGPTLVRTSEDNMTDMVTHMPDRYKIVETLIVHHDWFFSDSDFDQDEKAPEDRQSIQPAPNIDHLLSNIGRPGMPGDTSGSTTSDSFKSKISPSPKKDLNPMDFLPKSIVSAVPRKRKKCLSTPLSSSSVDEDSEHEPVKASNYGEEEDREEEEQVKEKHAFPTSEQRQGGGEPASDTSEEAEEWREDLGKEIEIGSTRRSDVPSPLHVVLHAPPPVDPYHLKSHSLATGRSIPFWVPPSMYPNPYQPSSHQGAQPSHTGQSVRFRKNIVERARARSMCLDSELGKGERRARGWRTDKVEVIRVMEGTVGPRGSVLSQGSLQKIDSLPFSFTSPPWIDPKAHKSSTVVLRGLAQHQRDKTRALRRHTVVV